MIDQNKASYTKEEEAELMKQWIAEANELRAATEREAAETAKRYTPPNETRITADKQAMAIQFARDLAAKDYIEQDLATDTTTCQNAQDLAAVLVRYIRYIGKTDNRAVRLYEMQKRFGIKAAHFGSTVKQLLATELKKGALTSTNFRGVPVYYDTDTIAILRLGISDMGEVKKFLDSYLERAFEALKRK